ncbi:MAG: hypothetical protein DRR19_03875 [Candidatus Parabeggiatoa sp. nov. 1]|nr:MAG: hypothetical protein DRR19_03875 [Gammaproteobacteria bacterium]
MPQNDIQSKVMEFIQLKESFTQLLAAHNAPNVRYRGLGLSANAPADLAIMTETLQTLLPEYTLWELGQNGVPELPCHRAVFLEQAFEVFKRGLIIYLPEEWMYEWSTLDKRAFWAALSETYGRHTVIAVFADTFDNTRLVEPYLNVKPLSSLPVRVWVSKYQQA